jgi:hypothetical protein
MGRERRGRRICRGSFSDLSGFGFGFRFGLGFEWMGVVILWIPFDTASTLTVTTSITITVAMGGGRAALGRGTSHYPFFSSAFSSSEKVVSRSRSTALG